MISVLLPCEAASAYGHGLEPGQVDYELSVRQGWLGFGHALQCLNQVCVCVCVCPSSPPNQHPVFMLQWFLRIMSIIQLKLAVVHDLSLNSLGWSQNAFYLGLRGGSLVHQGQLCIALKKKHLFLKKNRKPSLEDSIITRWLATWLSGWLLLVAILVMVYR